MEHDLTKFQDRIAEEHSFHTKNDDNTNNLFGVVIFLSWFGAFSRSIKLPKVVVHGTPYTIYIYVHG